MICARANNRRSAQEDADFTFSLRAVGAGPPTEVRVKRLLKELGRKHRLKVRWPEPITAPKPPPGERRILGPPMETTARQP